MDIGLIYVGPDADVILGVATRSGFKPVLHTVSPEDVAALVRDHAEGVGAVAMDAHIDPNEQEGLVAFLHRSQPDLMVAVVGDVEEDERKRLDLLGVRAFIEPTDEGLKALHGLSSTHHRSRSAGDWSFRVERENWVEITVPSQEEYVSRVQEMVEMLEKSKLDQDTRDELMLAIDELVRNAMEWGNRYDARRRVLVSYYCAEDRVVLKVEDEGRGFNVEQLKDPTEDLAQHVADREAAGKRPGGLGVHLIRNMMDEVLYNDTGNVVMLTKFIAKDSS